MKKNILSATLVLVLVSAPLWSEDQAAKPDTSAKRTDIINFGLESDLLDLLKQLRTENNSEFNKALLDQLANSKSPKVKEELIRFFTDLKSPDAIELAKSQLNPDLKMPNSLVLASIGYLAENGGADLKDSLLAIIEAPNKPLAVAAIRALGKLHLTETGEYLYKKYQDPDFDDGLKPDTIWSLGELKYGPALETFLADSQEAAVSPLKKAVLIEAIGKYATETSLNRILLALSDDNLQVKTKALQALRGYPLSTQTSNSVKTATKDGQSSIRIAAIETLGFFKDQTATELVRYRAKNDPDLKVRISAVTSLFQIDSTAALKIAQDFFADKETNVYLLRSCAEAILSNGLSDGLSLISTKLDQEKTEKNRFFTLQLADFVANRPSQLSAMIVETFLSDENLSVRLAAIKAIGLNRFESYKARLESLGNDKKIPAGALQTALKQLESAATPK